MSFHPGIADLVYFQNFFNIDANFLYYDRIDKRINNLQKLVDITGKPLEENTALMEEYQDILVELETAREKAISHATSTEDSQQDKLLKFAGAAALWVFAAIGVLFSKKKDEAITLKKVFSNILGSVFCIAFGWLLGYIFTFIPTLGAVWVNIILAPIIQVVVIWLIIETPNRKKTPSTTAT